MAKKTIAELREFIIKNMPSNAELKVKPFRTLFSYIIDHLEDIPGTLNINTFMYKVFGTSNIDDVDFQEYFGEEFTGNNLVSYLQWLVETGITVESNISEEIISDVNVGGVNVGQQISKGTSLTQFAKLLLNKIFYPTFTAPSLTLTSNAGSREIGETFDLVLNSSFNRGAITVNGNFQDYRSGAATAQSVDGTAGPSKTITGYVTLPNQNFTAITDYAAGVQPKDSKGDDFGSPLAAGSLTATTSFSGGLRRFAGQMNAPPSNGAQVRAALLGTSVLNGGNSFAITANGTDKTFVIAIPTGKTLKKVVTSNNETLTSNFALSVITTVPDAGGDLQSYNVYTYTTVGTFTAGLILNIEIQ